MDSILKLIADYLREESDLPKEVAREWSQIVLDILEGNERLQADHAGCDARHKYCADREARLDAALKIAEGASLQTTSASVIGEIIAALEGE